MFMWAEFQSLAQSLLMLMLAAFVLELSFHILLVEGLTLLPPSFLPWLFVSSLKG